MIPNLLQCLCPLAMLFRPRSMLTEPPINPNVLVHIYMFPCSLLFFSLLLTTTTMRVRRGLDSSSDRGETQWHSWALERVHGERIVFSSMLCCDETMLFSPGFFSPRSCHPFSSLSSLVETAPVDSRSTLFSFQVSSPTIILNVPSKVESRSTKSMSAR